MYLKPITTDEDKTIDMYASADCQQLFSMYDDFYPESGFHSPWLGYFIIRQDKIVGSCAFVGKPKDRKVEIAYWTFKEFEGQGIASFGCNALLCIAYQTDPGLTVVAKTAPEHNASTRVLENNHFVFAEIVQDHEIGSAWLWTHNNMAN